MEDQNFLEDYKAIYQPKISNEIENYFNYLAEKSQIDLEKAHQLEDEFRQVSNKQKNASSQEKNSRNKRNSFIGQIIFSIFLTTLSILFLYLSIKIKQNENNYYDYETWFFILIGFNTILLIFNLVTIIVWPSVMLFSKKHKGKFKENKILILHIVVVLFLAIITTLTYLLINLYSNDGYQSTYIASIFFIVLWILLSFEGIVPLVRFWKIQKQDKSILDGINQNLSQINKHVKENLSPLINLCKMDGIYLEIANKIFPFITLNYKTSQSVMDITYIKNLKKYSKEINQLAAVEFVQSGFLNNSPFVYLSTNKMEYLDKTYEGSLQITYKKRVKVWRNGGYKSEWRTFTETLRAQYTAPAPNYSLINDLFYSNDLIPELNFSRSPNRVDEFSSNKLEKFIEKQSQKFQKEYKKSVNSDSSFQPILGNLKFESLFNCFDRTNEKNYRLLFTPLAQKQYEKILLTRDFSDGDNFWLAKKEEIHKIKKPNLLNFHAPKYFNNYINSFPDMGLCFTNLKQMFLKAYKLGIENLFKSLAPFIAIPMYMEEKTKKVWKNDFLEDIAMEEIEADINAGKFDCDYNDLKHPSATGINIYNVTNKKQIGNKANFDVTAYGHKEIPHTEYIPVKAGNDKYYKVPVKWIEYKPVKKTTKHTQIISSRSEIINYLITKN
ncbi:MAG1210 family protein [Mycoplasma buteonis]|uniref:MAG1210 family protein n=1 Tax=Mycoplasma buteonis TaxID=171280 RepID=UPI000565CB39|nr:hypothetical protein [Mycoplasma buteonis]